MADDPLREKFVRRKWLEREFALSDGAAALMSSLESVAPFRPVLYKLFADDDFMRQVATILKKHHDEDVLVVAATE